METGAHLLYAGPAIEAVADDAEGESLLLRGDVGLGSGVVVRGSVTIEKAAADQWRIEDGAVLDGRSAAAIASATVWGG